MTLRSESRSDTRKRRRPIQLVLAISSTARGALQSFVKVRAKRARKRAELRDIPEWLRKDVGLPEDNGEPKFRNWWEEPRN